jgi:hypothetical protein
VLLNCLGKLFEKILTTQMQFNAQSLGLTDKLQFGGLMMRSTVDASIHAYKHIQESRLKGEGFIYNSSGYGTILSFSRPPSSFKHSQTLQILSSMDSLLL